MKYSLENPVSSRKKQAPDHIDEKTTSLIHSPNFKYQFLTNEAGSLLRQLRKDQFSQIMNLLNSNIKKVDKEMTEKVLNKVLICVGAPGTGKTSVIKQAIAEYQNECKSINKKQSSVYSVSSIRVLFVNGNALRKLEQLKKQISMQNTDESYVRVLQKIIKIEKSTENCVLNVIYIEQFQKIVESNNEDELKQFLQLFGNRKSKEDEDKMKKTLQEYVLIGTSNNVNIEQMMLKKIGVCYRLKTIVFKPYPMQQKIKIVHQRINQIKQRLGIELKIPQRLIKFIIMKLNQNKRDDTRTLIDVIKQILLISQSNQSVIDSIERGQAAAFNVSLEILQQHQKIRGMLMNSKVDLIQILNIKQHLVLALLYRELKTNQTIQMRYNQLEQEFYKAQREMGLQYSGEAKTMVDELELYGLIQMRNKILTKAVTKNDKLTCKASIILKVSFNDVERALSKVPLLSKYFS